MISEYRVHDIERILISHWMDPLDMIHGLVADHMFDQGYDVSVSTKNGVVTAMKVNWPGEPEWYGINRFGHLIGEVGEPGYLTATLIR